MSSTGLEQFYKAIGDAGGVFHPYRFKVTIMNNDSRVMADSGFDMKKYGKFFVNNIRTNEAGGNTPSSKLKNSSESDQFTFFAQSASLPGRNVTEVETHFLGMTFSVPYGMTYEKELQLSIICDSKMQSRKFCEEWMDVHSSLEKASGGIKGILDINTELQLLNTMLDNEIPTEIYTLVGCWPKRIGDISLDHSATGHSTFNFTLAYQFFTNEKDNQQWKILIKK
jgi:hypothetical protein